MPSFDLVALSAALGGYSREHDRDILRDTIVAELVSDPEQPLLASDLIQTSFFRDEKTSVSVTLDVQVRERQSNVVEQTNPLVIFNPQIAKLRDIENISTFSPEELLNTWADHIENHSAPRRTRSMPQLSDIEFEEWLINDLIRKITEGIIVNTLFQGVYTAGNTYANSYAGAFDGFLTVITAGIISGLIDNVIPSGGAITALNAFAKLEEFGKALPRHMRNRETYLLCSETIADWYNANHQVTYPGQNQIMSPSYKRYRLKDRTNVVIVPVAEMGASQRLICVSDDTMRWNHDWRGEDPILTFMPKNVKEIQVGIQMSQSVNFHDPRMVAVNDLV